MQHKFVLEALDWTLQELLKNIFLFGGITVLFGGDFYHTLPIIPKGSKLWECCSCMVSVIE